MVSSKKIRVFKEDWCPSEKLKCLSIASEAAWESLYFTFRLLTWNRIEVNLLWSLCGPRIDGPKSIGPGAVDLDRARTGENEKSRTRTDQVQLLLKKFESTRTVVDQWQSGPMTERSVDPWFGLNSGPFQMVRLRCFCGLWHIFEYRNSYFQPINMVLITSLLLLVRILESHSRLVLL